MAVCVYEYIDLCVTVIRNRDVCVIGAYAALSSYTALRVRGEGVKVTERLQRHNCGQVCVFLREEEASHSFSVSLSLRLFLFCV